MCVIAYAAIVAANFECEPDVPYIENDCNGCFCGPSKQLGCTLKGCFGEHYDALVNCKVGTVTKRDCNTCWCTEEYGTICTNHKC